MQTIIRSGILPLLALGCLLLPAPLLATEDGGDGDLDNLSTPVGHELVSPQSALISPSGAHLTVRQKAAAKKFNGHSVINFVLPPDSSNLQLNVPGYSIVRWSSTPALLNSSSDLAGRRARVEKEKTELNARLMTINSRLALWQAPGRMASAQELNLVQNAMNAEMPRLALEQAELQRRLKLVDEELSRMPQASGLGERVRVVLAEDVPEGKMIDVEYSYTHDSCGWDPIYIFNAKTDEGAGDAIDVRMLAEVWQFTGMDWKNTHISLATRGAGPREPAPLPEWVIDSQAHTPQPRAALKAAKPMVMSAEAANEAAAGRIASTTPNTDTLYATWQLSATGLPQGRARMQISDSVWKTPLQWLARPSREDAQVWIYAVHSLPQDQVWPAGQAEYNVNGQNVGAGIFRPKNGEATLYFGADPRVNIRTVVNSRKRGESGFIHANKTWDWSWTYIILNEHNKPVKVKVERPLPVIVDPGVTVSYANKPEAKTDASEHMQYWLMDVPAHGKATIDHGITISSPTKLPLLPDIL